MREPAVLEKFRRRYEEICGETYYNEQTYVMERKEMAHVIAYLLQHRSCCKKTMVFGQQRIEILIIKLVEQWLEKGDNENGRTA